MDQVCYKLDAQCSRKKIIHLSMITTEKIRFLSLLSYAYMPGRNRDLLYLGG